MNKMIYLALAFVATMGFVACGDDKDDNKETTNTGGDIQYTWTEEKFERTYQTAEAFADTIQLVSLKSDAKVESYVRTWADAIILPTELTNGVVTVVIKGDANPEPTPRTAEFKFYDASKNTVTLKINQIGKPTEELPAETDINNPNNEESDQPAFGRR